MELIKKITKAGNSSNVLLPKEWLGGTARVELIEKPINIVEDTIKILGPHLKNILGIYLTGSYARGEETSESDIDILTITIDLNQKIKKGKYEIILISKENLDKAIKKNIIPLLPMIREAKPIINEELIKKYSKIKPNKKNLKWIADITKSSRRICAEDIKLSRELGENVSDGIIYSIILGLRSVYTIDCLKKGKTPTKKRLMSLIKKISKTKEPYNAYLRSKNNKPDAESVSPDVAEKLNEYVIGILNE